MRKFFQTLSWLVVQSSAFVVVVLFSVWPFCTVAVFEINVLNRTLSAIIIIVLTHEEWSLAFKLIFGTLLMSNEWKLGMHIRIWFQSPVLLVKSPIHIIDWLTVFHLVQSFIRSFIDAWSFHIASYKFCGTPPCWEIRSMVVCNWSLTDIWTCCARVAFGWRWRTLFWLNSNNYIKVFCVKIYKEFFRIFCFA